MAADGTAGAYAPTESLGALFEAEPIIEAASLAV
jgi:hypothetical protein